MSVGRTTMVVSAAMVMAAGWGTPAVPKWPGTRDSVGAAGFCLCATDRWPRGGHGRTSCPYVVCPREHKNPAEIWAGNWSNRTTKQSSAHLRSASGRGFGPCGRKATLANEICRTWELPLVLCGPSRGVIVSAIGLTKINHSY